VQRSQVPELKRIVVAIDPAVTCGENSDETGVLVCGLGADNHGYVLEDASGKYLPPEWARRAISLYNKYGAERIVAEQNQGGMMVEMTLRAVDPNVSYRGVHAARGKLVRAEPIAVLFEQRRCHIVGIANSRRSIALIRWRRRFARSTRQHGVLPHRIDVRHTH
jgi:phage terminase large subunit-like protein